MKQLFAATAAATIVLGAASPALADDHADDMENKDYVAESPEVIERNDRGQATRIKIGDNEYDVCMSEDQDNCINPRAAGLDWGDRPLNYWPGETESD
ncbi:hypothetical protein ACRAQ6_11795 [Erythrobacter sp. HA6-11]